MVSGNTSSLNNGFSRPLSEEGDIKQKNFAFLDMLQLYYFIFLFVYSRAAKSTKYA